MTQLRDALFEHEMFLAEAAGSSFGMDHVRRLESTWPFSRIETEAELEAMRNTGLVTISEGNYWAATLQGKIAREKRQQELGQRHPALLEQKAAIEDLILSLIVSAGRKWSAPDLAKTFPACALPVYLWFRTESEISAGIESLIDAGKVAKVDPSFTFRPDELMATAEGQIYYAHNIIPLLGLLKDATILAPLAPETEPPMFSALGLPPIVTDNLQFRWEEAERCRKAGAWLSQTVMYGSILEALLVSSLEVTLRAAMSSIKAPRDKAGRAPPLKDWRLESLLNVAADIGLVDSTLVMYGHALRDARNLVHPEKQIRERSQPDERVTDISGRVVRSVIESLARRANSPGNP
jgi:hypothetical protein